ncbi:MAG: sensor N-terminal transmembrane domain-containing protein, partial [Sphingomicrobium sp.]
MNDATETGDASESEGSDLVLSWSGRWTLTHRILAVNILTLVLIAFSIIYLDVFRNRLSKERVRQTRTEAVVTAAALNEIPLAARSPALAAIGNSTGGRIRLYGPGGRLVADSWQLSGPTYRLVDPETQGWKKDAARALDRGFNTLVGARPLEDFTEPRVDRLQSWPEA